MNCPNCGTVNQSGSTFCINCGTKLQEAQANNNIASNEKNISNIQNQNIQQTVSQPISNTSNTVSLNYLKYMVASFLKPMDNFLEEAANLEDTKTSVILALIVTVIMTLINIVKTILTTVRVTNYSFSGGLGSSWQWDNLKNIQWLGLIGKSFLIYICIIGAIALMFYIGSLVVKKELSFVKSLSIASTSLIPSIVGIMILSPLGGLIWSPLSVVFMIVGAIYTLIVLYELMNNELDLDGDIKIYFNLICFGVLIVIGYFVYMKLIISSVTSGLGNMLDLFE